MEYYQATASPSTTGKYKIAIDNFVNDERLHQLNIQILLYRTCTIILCIVVIVLLGHYDVFDKAKNNDNAFSNNPTKGPALPGVYYMTKAYNLLSGQPIYSQSGIDVISFQYDGRLTNSIDGTEYEIPIEFQSVPNIAPSCDISTSVNDVFYSTSSSVLFEQTSRSSHGFSMSVEASAGFNVAGIYGNLKTTLTAAVITGHSSTSESARKYASSSDTWSFSMDTLATYYKAAINWKDAISWKQKRVTFNWKKSFRDSLNDLNKNPTNQSILLFFNNWGTHTLNAMQTGSYCKETSYSSSKSTQSQVYDFQSHVQSDQGSFSFWNWNSESSDQTSHSGTYENGVKYTFTDIYCKGEIAVTSACGGLTGTTNNPVVTSYVLQPIWEINDVINMLNDEALNNTRLFIKYLFHSLSNCSTKYCYFQGVCTLNQNVWDYNFINNVWNGIDFEALWNITSYSNDNKYCFCMAQWYGNDCSSPTNCQCFGKTDCCCYEPSNTCDSTLLCNPSTSLCLNSNFATIKCGKPGQFISCQSGVITSVCGSGKWADCTAYSGVCPANSYNGIKCNYPQLGGYSGSSQSWQCVQDGVNVDCLNNPSNGDLMIGLCGSNGNEACTEKCAGYAGILCGSIQDISVNQTECEWLTQYDWGVFLQCKDGYVATGYCGSGENKDCDGDVFKLKCCRLNYT